MKFNAKHIFTFSLFAAVAFFPYRTCAAVLSISSSGGGVYVLQGSGFSNVGGLDATITYDASTLSRPTVSGGTLISGAILVPNTNLHGIIRMTFISAKPISGTGPVAVINFRHPVGRAGKVLRLGAKLYNSAGVLIPVRTVLGKPVVKAKDRD